MMRESAFRLLLLMSAAQRIALLRFEHKLPAAFNTTKYYQNGIIDN
jgi:hypothetical protein